MDRCRHVGTVGWQFEGKAGCSSRVRVVGSASAASVVVRGVKCGKNEMIK